MSGSWFSGFTDLLWGARQPQTAAAKYFTKDELRELRQHIAQAGTVCNSASCSACTLLHTSCRLMVHSDMRCHVLACMTSPCMSGSGAGMGAGRSSAQLDLVSFSSGLCHFSSPQASSQVARTLFQLVGHGKMSVDEADIIEAKVRIEISEAWMAVFVSTHSCWRGLEQRCLCVATACVEHWRKHMNDKSAVGVAIVIMPPLAAYGC